MAFVGSWHLLLPASPALIWQRGEIRIILPEITLAPPGTAIWDTTYGNFAPRVGIAYRLNDEGTAVLRAGFGLFYDTGAGSAASLAKNFPNYVFQSFPGIGMPVNNLTSYLPVTSLNPPYPFAEGFAPNLSLPRSYQWNVALEKSFSGNQAVSVTYVGQAGRSLLRQAAFYQPTPDFSSEFFLTGNDARSNYDALQVAVPEATDRTAAGLAGLYLVTLAG